jgi:hypothetical protein
MSYVLNLQHLHSGEEDLPRIFDPATGSKPVAALLPTHLSMEGMAENTVATVLGYATMNDLNLVHSFVVLNLNGFEKKKFPIEDEQDGQEGVQEAEEEVSSKKAKRVEERTVPIYGKLPKAYTDHLQVMAKQHGLSLVLDQSHAFVTYHPKKSVGKVKGGDRVASHPVG